MKLMDFFEDEDAVGESNGGDGVAEDRRFCREFAVDVDDDFRFDDDVVLLLLLLLLLLKESEKEKEEVGDNKLSSSISTSSRSNFSAFRGSTCW